jgi:anhydro-N-acetylmuramic acid kinase
MMSGTSLDGLDMALCEFSESDQGWNYRLLHTGFSEYSQEMHSHLEEAITYSAEALLALHESYGRWLGKQAKNFLNESGSRVDAIASHGHTVHHRPEEGFTFQLGSPQQIALQSGCMTLGDFRSMDVALGGQGAPLVPVGDRLLFATYDFCLNLGGICNISFEHKGDRIAFDIGVANMLLNYLCAPMGKTFDKDGDTARKGSLNTKLLQALDALPYYGDPFPKSTGYEWFRDAVIPLLSIHPDTPENLLHTGVRHIAGQISRSVQSLSGSGAQTVLVTGGGAFNSYLIEVLQELLGKRIRLELPGPELISYKEALGFGFLGALRLAGRPNVLASVTGAERDSCSGILYLP